MRTVTTQNSVYEINMDRHMIRRLEGVNKPAPNLGEDGVWQQYLTCTLINGRLFIRWDDQGKATCTSRVVADSMEWPTAGQAVTPDESVAA